METPSSQPESRPDRPARSFQSIFGSERDYLRPPQFTTSLRPTPDESAGPGTDAEGFVGLALSGGGIRSAAFSLGALQALQSLKAFEAVDFLSTVSGGGYTGAAVLAGQERKHGAFPFDADPQDGGTRSANDISDSPEIRGLRDRCRYLMPDGKFDLMISLAIILRGLVVNAVMVATPLFLLASLTLFALPLTKCISRPLPATSALAAAYLLVLIVWAIGRSLSPTASRSGGDAADPRSTPARLMAYGLCALIIVLVIELQPMIIKFYDEAQKSPSSWMPQLDHAFTVLTAGTGILALSWRTLLGQIQALSVSPKWHASLKSISLRIVLLVLSMALPLAIYLGYLGLVTHALNGETSSKVSPLSNGLTQVMLLAPIFALSAIGIWIVQCGAFRETLFNPVWWSGNGARSPATRWALAGIAASALVLLCIGLQGSNPVATYVAGKPMALIYLDIAAGAAVISRLFSENANSLHRLYRDRLSEAFRLGDTITQTASIPLSTFKAPYANGAPRRPYPIINAAVNLQGSRANRRQRNADFFIFTPHHVGSDATGYVAAEAGRWTGNGQSGTYMAAWRKVTGQWVIESELFVTLA